MTLTAHHLYLLVPGASPDEVRRFYAEGLGLREIAKPESLTAIPVLWFSAGPVVFHVGFPAEGRVGDGHTAFAADDLDAVRARLVGMGYGIDETVIPMGYPRFYARDPWGNQFEILPEGLP